MEMCSSPSVDEKVGKELNALPGVSKHCSSQNHLQDGGTVYALKGFLGSRDSQHKVVYPTESPDQSRRGWWLKQQCRGACAC